MQILVEVINNAKTRFITQFNLKSKSKLFLDFAVRQLYSYLAPQSHQKHAKYNEKDSAQDYC